MNKSVTKYIFPNSSFHAEHVVDIYFHVQHVLRKLEGLLQPNVSLFIPPPSLVLSQYITFYEVRRNIKMEKFYVLEKNITQTVPTSLNKSFNKLNS